MPGLADALIADGSIRTLDAAAVWRLHDAGVLYEHGRRSAAAYLFGYAAEMRLTASCFRLVRFGEDATIARSQREGLEREARKLNLMSTDPHDLAGWMRLLVYLRKRESTRYDRPFRDELVAQVDGLYENWRPRLRYRALNPSGTQLAKIRAAAQWLNFNYTELWR